MNTRKKRLFLWLSIPIVIGYLGLIYDSLYQLDAFQQFFQFLSLGDWDFGASFGNFFLTLFSYVLPLLLGAFLALWLIKINKPSSFYTILKWLIYANLIIAFLAINIDGLLIAPLISVIGIIFYLKDSNFHKDKYLISSFSSIYLLLSLHFLGLLFCTFTCI